MMEKDLPKRKSHQRSGIVGGGETAAPASGRGRSEYCHNKTLTRDRSTVKV